jgi:hypothetical protein
MNNGMKWIGITGIVFAMSVPLAACAGNAATAQPPLTSLALSPAPDFQAVDAVTGQAYKLSQFAGKMVVLNIVNYGCNPATNQIVEKQVRALKQLQSERNDFVPVSVFCGCCTVESIRSLAQQEHLSWPLILDDRYEITGEYVDSVNTYGYPALIFINQAQFTVANSGYLDQTDLAKQLDSMAASK